LHDERLAAGERELLDPECDGFVDERPHVVERHALQAAVARLRALEAERAGEIAGRAGVEPELPQGVRLDVAARLAERRVVPRIALRIHRSASPFERTSPR